MCSGVLLHTSSFRNQRRGTRIYKVAVNIYVAGSRGLTSAINVKKKKKGCRVHRFSGSSFHSFKNLEKKERSTFAPIGITVCFFRRPINAETNAAEVHFSISCLTAKFEWSVILVRAKKVWTPSTLPWWFLVKHHNYSHDIERESALPMVFFSFTFFSIINIWRNAFSQAHIARAAYEQFPWIRATLWIRAALLNASVAFCSVGGISHTFAKPLSSLSVISAETSAV